MVKLISSKDMDALLPSEKLCRNDPNNGSQAVTCTKDNFFEFKIIESNQLNAFAVPGGYVYFYTQILKGSKGFQSESELMSVMGHEIGHVVLHHSRDRMVKQAGATALIQIFLGDGIAGVIGLLGANFWLTSNGQEDESASDSMGFYYTNKMGISSQGLSDFFSRGLKMNSDGTCDEKDNSSVLDVFSTHPPSCKRVMDNKGRMDAVNQNFQKDKNTSPSGKKFKELVTAAGI
jgi:predicted Zn-dependent protease